MTSRWTQDTLDELAVSHKARTRKPIEWHQESLGNLFTLQLGKMLNKKAREAFPKFPYLGNKDVQWGRFDFSELREMHFDEEERTKFRLIPGDLLVCEGGEIGRTALWTGEFDCYYQKAIHRLRVRTPVRAEARFILHFMRFAATNRLFTDLSSQSSIAHLTREKLALLKVPLPPLPEQRKIAAILSSVDDAIEKTQAVIDQVQVVKRGLMQRLFSRGLPGGSDCRTEWTKNRLSSLFTLQLGKMLNKKARETLPRFPYLGNKDVQWGRLNSSELREMHFEDREREKFRLMPGDLLVCEGGEIGRTALWTGEFDCYFQKAIHRLRARDAARVEPRFTLHFMRFAATNGLLTDLISQSSIAHLTREKLSHLEVPLPPLHEQRKIADILSAVDDFIKETQATIQQAGTTKRSLMSVLLTGELRVTPDTEAA